MGHNQLKNKALKVAEVRAEYDALGPEFTLLRKYADAVGCSLEIRLVCGKAGKVRVD